MEKQVKASTAAVDKLTVAQQDRTALCFFDAPVMRHTPAAAQYRQAVMIKVDASCWPGGAPCTGSHACAAVAQCC